MIYSAATEPVRNLSLTSKGHFESQGLRRLRSGRACPREIRINFSLYASPSANDMSSSKSSIRKSTVSSLHAK